MLKNIQWTDLTDNIIHAKDDGWWCQKISPSCVNCYSENLNQNTFFGLFEEEVLAPIPDHAISNRLSQLFNTLLPVFIKQLWKSAHLHQQRFQACDPKAKEGTEFPQHLQIREFLFLCMNKNKFPSTVTNSWGIQN